MPFGRYKRGKGEFPSADPHPRSSVKSEPLQRKKSPKQPQQEPPMMTSVPFTVPTTPHKTHGFQNTTADSSGLTQSDTSLDEHGFLVLPPTIDKSVTLRDNLHKQQLESLLHKDANAVLHNRKKNDGQVQQQTSTERSGKRSSRKKTRAPPPQQTQQTGSRSAHQTPTSTSSRQSRDHQSRRMDRLANISNSSISAVGNTKEKNQKGKFLIGKRSNSAFHEVKKTKATTPKPKAKPKRSSTADKKTDQDKQQMVEGTCEWRMFDLEEKVSSDGLVSFHATPVVARPLAPSTVGLSLLSASSQKADNRKRDDDDAEETWNDPPDKMIRESIYRHIQFCVRSGAGGGITFDDNAAVAKIEAFLPTSLPVDVDNVSFVEADNNPAKVDAVALQNIAEGNPHAALDFLSVLLQAQRHERTHTTSWVALESDIATTKSKLAMVSLLAMNYDNAFQYAVSALQTHKKAGRPVQTALATIELGLVYMGADRRAEALRAWREALQLACMTMGYDHGQVAVLLANLGCLHFYAGNLSSSLRVLEESLGLQRQLLRSIRPDDNVDMPLFQMATTMENLALVSAKCKSYDTAISLLEEALAIQESILTTTEEVRITLVRFIEHLTRLRDESDVQEKKSYGETAPQSCSPMQYRINSILQQHPSISVFGDSDGIPRRHEADKHHPSSSRSEAWFSSEDDNTFSCIELGSLAKPSSARQRVHATIVRSLGRSMQTTRGKDRQGQQESTFSSTAVSRKKSSIPVDLDADSVIDAEFHLQEIHEQVYFHLSRHEYQDALELFESALRSHKDKYGDIHHLVGTALHNCGFVKMVEEDYIKAKPFFQEAVDVRTVALGETHPDVAASKLKIGMIQLAKGDPECALSTFMDIMSELGANPSSYGFLPEAKMLNNIGVVYFETGRTIDAFQSMYEAHNILKGSTCAPAERAFASTVCNLGYIYAEQKQYNDALEAFLQASVIVKKYYPMKSSSVVTLEENIAYVKAYGAVMSDQVASDAGSNLLKGCGGPAASQQSDPTQSKIMDSCIPLETDNDEKEKIQSNLLGSCGKPESGEEVKRTPTQSSFFRSCVPISSDIGPGRRASGAGGKRAQSKLTACFLP